MYLDDIALNYKSWEYSETMSSPFADKIRALEARIKTLLDGASVNYLRALAYPAGDWYGDLERRAFFKTHPELSEVGAHRLRELAKFTLSTLGH